MKLSGLEKRGYVLLFLSPDEFYVKFIVGNESLKFLKTTLYEHVPTKNQVCAKAKFIVEYNSDLVLCEILEDLKYDEVFCQILLINSNIRLKVDFRRLIYLSMDDIINEDNCVNLKINDFSPIFPYEWSPDIIDKLKRSLTYEKFIFRYISTKPDPSDGRMPVDVLWPTDRRSVVDELIQVGAAMSGEDYYRAAIEGQISMLFHPKKRGRLRYKVSYPLAKEKPKTALKSASTLNIEAPPFTPLLSPVTTENPEHLTSNIVSMFTNMYKNHHNFPSANCSPIMSPFPSDLAGLPFHLTPPVTVNHQHPAKSSNIHSAINQIQCEPSTQRQRNSSDTIDISSIPLPPERHNSAPISTDNSSSIDSSPQVISPNHEDPSDEHDFQEPFNNDSPISNVESPPTVQRDSTHSPPLASSFHSLTIQPIPSVDTSLKRILSHDRQSSPFNVDKRFWNPNIPVIFSPMIPPQTTSYFLPHNNPLEIIGRRNLYPFYQNPPNIGRQIFSANNHNNNGNFIKVLPGKDDDDDDHHNNFDVCRVPPNQAGSNRTVNETFVDSSLTNQFAIVPQPANFYVQPFNLIYYGAPTNP